MTNCRNLDAHDDAQLAQAMQMAQAHESGAQVERAFSFTRRAKATSEPS
ncbi:MAG: hypothetical protein ACLTXI_01835 [Collinsella sp.]